MAILSAAVGPFVGVGLFTGCHSQLRFLPAAAGTGIRVQRLSFDQVATQRALVSHVAPNSAWAGPAAPLVRNTTLLVTAQPPGADAPDAAKIAATIEHAMSALAGLGVWDATIEISAAEVPILDGSARDFVAQLQPALVERPSPQPIRLTRTVEVRERDAVIIAEPVSEMRDMSMTYHLDYGGRGGLLAQSATWTGSTADYATAIAPARTFGMKSELAIARTLGQFAWLSEHDMLVFDDTNAGGPSLPLRFDNEPARHKLLDLIGDLALLGAPLQAKVTATRSGHALTHELCRAILHSR
jgi:UDP-3-O-[3-hydroxymyristoyl] N-acetylglucosamine deacetylase